MAPSLLTTMWRSEPTKHRNYAALLNYLHEDQAHRLAVLQSEAHDPLSRVGASPPAAPTHFDTMQGRSAFESEHTARYFHVRSHQALAVD